jgi:hypothetical protein
MHFQHVPATTPVHRNIEWTHSRGLGMSGVNFKKRKRERKKNKKKK